VLKIVLDMNRLQGTGLTRGQALKEMTLRDGHYDPKLLAGVCAWDAGAGAPISSPAAVVRVRVKELAPGMVLRSNVETSEGMLIVSSGYQINEMTLEKLRNFQHVSGIKEPILVEIPSGIAAGGAQ
jgi:hypothetical protein